MSTRQTDTVGSSGESAINTREDSCHDKYDADDESDPEPTTLSDALQMMQNRMRSSGLSTSTSQQRDHLGRTAPRAASQGLGYGSPISWTGTIVDLRCSDPERLWKPTYDTSECTRPRDLSSRPPHSGQGMPSNTQSISKAPTQQRSKAPPPGEQEWRAEVR